MARYNLSSSMSDRANYDSWVLTCIEEYIEGFAGAISEIDDDMILSLFETELDDPELIDDPEEGKARLLDIWHDLRERIKKQSEPKFCRLVSVPLTYQSPLIDSQPDGNGNWLVPLERFSSEDELWLAIKHGAQVWDGWCVTYNAPGFKQEVTGWWTGYQSEEQAYAVSLDVARQIGDWCCRQPALR